MEMNEDTYNLICDQLKTCLLPEFERDIGNEQLIKEDFSMFRYGLEMNLQLLFDIIARNDRLLLGPFEGDNTFRINFILLIHQQSGDDNGPFQTDSRSILKQIRLLADKYYQTLFSKPEIHMECFKYYKERLKTENWKRNIGAVYGFVQMTKLHQKYIQTKFKSDDCLFMLSVGMLLCDYFETIYKDFGLTIFNILLEFGNPKELKSLNLYQVIYKKLMTPLIVTMKEETTVVLVMTCLMKCIESFDGWRNPSTWNEVDDVLEEILKRIPFETDNRSAAIHFLFVLSLTSVSMENKPRILLDQIDFKNLDAVLKSTERGTEAKSKLFNELRNIFASYHNLLIARWSKKLIEIFKQRTAIVGSPNEIRYMLHIFHVVYLCCFYGNSLFLQMAWSEFLNEFVTSMLSLVTSNVDRLVFINEIYDLLETFKSHLENAPKDLLEGDEAKQSVSSFLTSLNDIKVELEKYSTEKEIKPSPGNIVPNSSS